MALCPRLHKRSGGRTVSAVLATVALFLTASCSLLNGSSGQTGGNSPNSAGLEHPNITIGLQPLADTAPFYIAQQKGYFKQAGLNISIKVLPGANPIINSMIAGGLDIGIGNYSSIFQAQSRHASDFRVIAGATEGNPGYSQVLTYPGSGINGPADLRNRNVAINTTENVPYLGLGTILEANNVPLNQVHFRVVQYADMAQAIVNKSMDAGLELDPYKTQAARTFGLRPVVDAFTGPAQSLPFEGYFTTAKFAAANPKTIAALVKALYQGAVIAAGSRQTVEQLLPSIANVDKETAQLVSLPTYVTSVSAKSLQRDADLMLNLHTDTPLLTQPLDVTPMVLNEPGS